MQVEDIVDRLRAGVVELDIDAIEPILHEQVTWGDCASRSNVLAMLTTFKEQGLSAKSSAFDQRADRIVASVVANFGDETVTVHNAVFIEDGLVVEIIDAESPEAACVIKRRGPYPAPGVSTGFGSVAPVLPVSDMTRAIVLYQQLGFDVESYDGGAFYAFAQRGEVHLHLSLVDNIDPLTTMVSVYLYVDDAKALFAEWREVGAAESGGRLHTPSDTDYGLTEGAYVDPWGNLLRFGSAIPTA